MKHESFENAVVADLKNFAEKHRNLAFLVVVLALLCLVLLAGFVGLSQKVYHLEQQVNHGQTQDQ